MGVAYYYFCDECNEVRYSPIAPFEASDAGENTPFGWKWDYETEKLLCSKCK